MRNTYNEDIGRTMKREFWAGVAKIVTPLPASPHRRGTMLYDVVRCTMFYDVDWQVNWGPSLVTPAKNCVERVLDEETTKSACKDKQQDIRNFKI